MTSEEIRQAAVIGAGTMGAGMGLCLALAGREVRLYDIAPAQLDSGLQRIDKALKLFVAEGLTSEEQAGEARNRITTTTQLAEALAGVQFVLEAVPEVLDLKQELFPQIESLVDEETILASNTSGLSITAIASVCRRPERVCGMHWFNPPEIVPLVEVTRGEKTTAQTAELVYKLTEKMGKAPVMVKKEAAGFIGNRMQLALIREALNILAEGVASPEDVDRAVKCSIGFRWSWQGPLETLDLAGLDVGRQVARYLFKDLSNMTEPPEFFERLVDSGRLGVKSGHGFYDYEPDAAEEVVRRRDLYLVRQWRLIQETKKS